MKKTVLLLTIQVLFFALYISAQKVVENRYNLGLAYTKSNIPRISFNIASDTTTGSISERALNILYSRRNYFKLNPTDNFQVEQIVQSPVGTHVLIRQFYNNVKISNAKGVVSFNRNDEIVCVSLDGNGKNHTINTIPTHSFSDAAGTITTRFAPKTIHIDESKAELTILQNSDTTFLTWQFYATPQGEPTYWCAVDAHNLSIIECADANAYYNPTTGSGMVFDPDPGSYLQLGNLPDSNDLNYYPVSTSYKQENLNGLIQAPDGKWRLQGEYAYAIDNVEPFRGLAEESSPTFNYTRNHPHFEEVNVYYHLDKQMRYIRSLGFRPSWNRSYFQTMDTIILFDAHAHINNCNSAFFLF